MTYRTRKTLCQQISKLDGKSKSTKYNEFIHDI